MTDKNIIFKIRYWNCMNGLSPKKILVKEKLNKDDIKIMFISECEITHNMLSSDCLLIDGYDLEYSNTINRGRSRLCVYIERSVRIKRRRDLEHDDNEIIVLEVGEELWIGLYRPFKCYEGETQALNFNRLMENLNEICKTTKDKKINILGDFNIDYAKMQKENYCNKKLATKLNEIVDNNNLIQHITNITRHRQVRRGEISTIQEAILDHIYTNYSLKTEEIVITNEPTSASDHNVIGMDIARCKKETIRRTTIIKRNWKKYSQDAFRNGLEEIGLENLLDYNDANSLNSNLESKIKKILDKLAPQKTYKLRKQDYIADPEIEKKKSRRDRIYKDWKNNKSTKHYEKLNEANRQLKATVENKRRQQIKAQFNPRNPADLWKKVKVVQGKNNTNSITLVENSEEIIDATEICEKFAEYFHNKIENLRSKTNISNLSHGKCIGELKNLEEEKITITEQTVYQTLGKLGNKTCEGPDHLPIRIFKDGKDILCPIITKLFNLILKEERIPDIWRLAKVVPLHKKGPKTEIINYRPISNLCSLSKIFEKCILHYIENLQIRVKKDLTGDWQHGFKRNRGTGMTLLRIQNYIATHLEQDSYVGLYSLDLSSAFDMLDRDCFEERLKSRGFPKHLTKILVDFVSDREQYITYNNINSYIRPLPSGCAQGSVLGPMIFNLFISPLDEIVDETIFGYADDSYLLCHSKNIGYLQRRLAEQLRKHIFWLKGSGLVVNETKTELIIFHKNSTDNFSIRIEDKIIESKEEIKALGITLQRNLKWDSHIKNKINSCKSTLFGLKTIRKYFEKEEFINLTTAFLYSKLFYAAEIWLNSTLGAKNWNRIESIHRATTRTIEENMNLTHEEILQISKRATPKEWSKYIEATTLFKILDLQDPTEIYTDIIIQSYTEPRQPQKLLVFDNSKNKIGKHKFINRIVETTKSLDFNWFGTELDIAHFRKNCKRSLFYYLRNE